MHIHRQQPLSAGLFRRGGKKCFSSDHSFIIPNEADREYHSNNRFCSTAQLGDWVLCIVFSQDFKITCTTYLPETTNSEGFAQIAKITICFSKLHTKSIFSVALHRKRHEDWCLPAESLPEQYRITLFDKLTVLTSGLVFHNEVNDSDLFI